MCQMNRSGSLSSPGLQLKQALLGTLQALQVLHHLGDVNLAGLVLHVGKPAASHTDHYGDHQDEVFHPVMLWTCGRPERNGIKKLCCYVQIPIYYLQWCGVTKTIASSTVLKYNLVSSSFVYFDYDYKTC